MMYGRYTKKEKSKSVLDLAMQLLQQILEATQFDLTKTISFQIVDKTNTVGVKVEIS